MSKTVIEYLASCPPMLEASDLVNMGLFSSVEAVAIARRRGLGPRAIRLSTSKYRYPIEAVVQYLVAAGLDIHEAANA